MFVCWFDILFGVGCELCGLNMCWVCLVGVFRFLGGVLVCV